MRAHRIDRVGPLYKIISHISFFRRMRKFFRGVPAMGLKEHIYATASAVRQNAV
nr:MAG TPA: hypothetical protein [Caudoviricetes sp.]